MLVAISSCWNMVFAFKQHQILLGVDTWRCPKFCQNWTRLPKTGFYIQLQEDWTSHFISCGLILNPATILSLCDDHIHSFKNENPNNNTVFSTSKSSYTPSTDSKYRTNKYNTCKVILMMTVTWKLSEVRSLLSSSNPLRICLDFACTFFGWEPCQIVI